MAEVGPRVSRLAPGIAGLQARESLQYAEFVTLFAKGNDNGTGNERVAKLFATRGASSVNSFSAAHRLIHSHWR